MRSLILFAAGALMLWGPGTSARVTAAEPARPATVLVYLAADATLTFDDEPTTSTSAVRRFVTPPLEPGKTFSYVLKAQTTRDGQTVTTQRKVQVRAGEETTVSLWPAERNEGPGAVVSTAYYPPNPGPAPFYYATPGAAYAPAYFPGGAVAPRALRFSELSPSYGAGPPGSYAPWATGTLIGR
jgi:uncharacterized protein (TIGR03000 family)